MAEITDLALNLETARREREELANVLKRWNDLRMSGHPKRGEHIRKMWQLHPELMEKIDKNRETEHC